MHLTYGSVCSGIEAATVAWEPLDWKASWFAEIEKFPSQVLAHHYPHVRNLGDMTALATLVEYGLIDAPDVLVGGTPCQDFSVAGRRAGLDGQRGQLTLVYLNLLDALDDARAAEGKPSCIAVWENVPGVLTHKSNPFGHVLAGFAGEDLPLEPPGGRWTDAGVVLGPKRAVAWRVLDAQYQRLAQRRRRVFVVTSARDGFDPARVLLEFEGVRRDSPPSREAGQDVAGTLDARTSGGGFPGTDGALGGHVVPAEQQYTHPTSGCLTGSGRGVARVADPRGQDPVVAVYDRLDVPGLPGGEHGLPGEPTDLRMVRGGGARLYGGGSGRERESAACLTAKGQRLDYEVENFVVDVAPTLRAGGNRTDGDRPPGTDVDTADSLIVQPVGFANAGHFGAMKEVAAGDPLRAKGGDTGNGGETLIVQCVDFQNARTSSICGTLDAEGQKRGNRGHGVIQSVAIRGRYEGATAELGGEQAHALRASQGGGDKPYVLAPVACFDDPRRFNGPHGGFEHGEVHPTLESTNPKQIVLAPVYPINPNALRSGEAKTPSPDAEGRVRLRDPGFGIGADGDPADTITSASPGYVAAPLPFDTTQITSKTNRSSPKAGDPGHPLSATAHPPSIAFSCKDHGGVASVDLSPTLRAMGHGESHANAGGQIAVAFNAEQTPSVVVHGTQDPCVSTECERTIGRNTGQENAVCVTEPVTHTLKAEGFDASEDGTGRGQPIVPYSIMPMNSGKDFKARETDIAQPLMAAGPTTGNQGGDYIVVAAPVMRVRRLLPVECERLQGFPDGHTNVPITPPSWAEKWPTRVKYAADGPRYKAIGNSKATTVVNWIGRRIILSLNVQPLLDEFVG